MRFAKMHGAGNDFVVLPDMEDRFALDAGLVRALCRPHHGLGADGVIRLAAPHDGARADVFMDYRNADGNVAEMCGNGVRCVAKYVIDHGLLAGPEVLIDTRGGVKAVTVTDATGGRVRQVRVDMGAPVVGKIDWLLEGGPRGVRVTTLSMGNPHAVILVDDVDEAPVAELGSALQAHPAFPDGANVEFIQVGRRNRLRGRIWERGVGETLASGTGASAMAAAAHLLGLADRELTVVLPGGELRTAWTETTLFVTGPAVEVASGELDEDWLDGMLPA
ncbi:MAG: diaminopimelate epimerase [Egibacteraceae bacterium]